MNKNRETSLVTSLPPATATTDLSTTEAREVKVDTMHRHHTPTAAREEKEERVATTHPANLSTDPYILFMNPATMGAREEKEVRVDTTHPCHPTDPNAIPDQTATEPAVAVDTTEVRVAREVKVDTTHPCHPTDLDTMDPATTEDTTREDPREVKAEREARDPQSRFAMKSARLTVEKEEKEVREATLRSANSSARDHPQGEEREEKVVRVVTTEQATTEDTTDLVTTEVKVAREERVDTTAPCHPMDLATTVAKEEREERVEREVTTPDHPTDPRTDPYILFMDPATMEADTTITTERASQAKVAKVAKAVKAEREARDHQSLSATKFASLTEEREAKEERVATTVTDET